MKLSHSLRGINIGGWLVAERWITPALFDGVAGDGELAVYSDLGAPEAKERLKRHRDTFITERDFRSIKKHGFAVVRIPIGYWSFGTTEDYADGEEYLDKAFDWAKKYKLKIIVDFHGLQGSQNGYDHSGLAGKVRFFRHGNAARALKSLEYLAQKYGHHPALLGLEVINEPKPGWCWYRLLKYYDQSIRVIENKLSPEVKIIVSDAFKPLKMAKILSKRGYRAPIVLDVHLYQVFSRKDKRMSYQQHLYKASYDWAELLDDLQQYMPVMVGEWSASLPGTMPKAEISPEDVERQYYRAQYLTFQDGSWVNCYWTYKAPNNGAWDYSSAYKRLEK